MAPFVHNELVFSNFTQNAGLFVALMRQSSRRFKSHVIRSVKLASIWHLLDATQDGKVIDVHVTDKAGHRLAWEELIEQSNHCPNEARRFDKLIHNAMHALDKQKMQKLD
jgi:hypothetical protein